MHQLLLPSTNIREIQVKSIVLFVLMVASQAYAQNAPTEFPADAVPLTANALQESISGKLYLVKLADGRSWKWQFNSNGNFSLNTSDGFSDTGVWSVKESKLCTQGRRIDASCNEIRQQGTVLYLKRDNGTVVGMTSQ